MAPGWHASAAGACAGSRLVFVFELGFYFRFGIFVDDDFVGLELVGVAG